MEVALTFGSLGDIIAVCQITIQLWKALGMGCASASDSAREYQDLRKDLDTFVQVLMHVVATYEQHESSPALSSLACATKSIINDCGVLMKEALDRLLPRYNDSLQAGGSGSSLKDACKKLGWFVREKERLHTLQDKLRKNTGRLSVLIVLATRLSSRADNATVISRIEEVRQHLDKLEQDYTALLSHLRNHETAHRQDMRQLIEYIQQSNNQESQGGLLDTVKKAFNAITQVKDILISVAEKVIHLQIMVSNSLYTRGLDPTKDLPITLEDALGFHVPLPMEWLEDWEDLNVLLELRFKKRKGYDMVLKRQFALEENYTGRDLDQTLPLTACLRRGMKINMSMVFINSKVVQGSCPRCKMAIGAPEDTTIQCQNKHCGMWFRMLKVPFREREDSFDQDAVPSFESELSNSKKRTKVFSIPAEPSDFQRVRLLSISPPSLHPSPPKMDLGEKPNPKIIDDIITMADDEQQLVVTTLGDLFKARNGYIRTRSKAILGQMSDDTLRRLRADHDEKHKGLH